METILDKIVATKREEIAAAKSKRPLQDLEKTVADAPPVRDFVASMQAAPLIGLIAEVKKASPSAGLIREDFDPVEIARTYEKHGASCISVLTDEQYFQGHLDFLTSVREAVQIPVLRKDFILDPYQVYEARAAGADAVLLIAECLDDADLRTLSSTISDLGMHALVEIHDTDNLKRVLQIAPVLLGINNRDLRTFHTDLNHTIKLLPQVPAGTLLVSESGIRTHADVLRLKDAGCGGILVGESLMRSADIGEAVDALMGAEG
ncbi:indole-3-glycerol phosphate synthase TrpC [Calycomorphotria hydatis]|uniref:Indole-3-glycerol phosphate synthase n=1 Tax=Calycomorphotria hydatis TaxID=2528027 RepID=A0A517TDS1_9PLAN|nr:indole-3-glycerol phosphate synthase TrpC [Calycomorphotria hydatis]QDT66523.1 Indole-3-glycerol phosphate synthase [Calycomorphotria hydatis]